MEIPATILFALAVVHTFSVKRFQTMARRYPEGSVLENLFHLLGEVEVVFGLWAGVLALAIAWHQGTEHSIGYLEGLNFTEPIFVFVIMTISSTRPILWATGRAIEAISVLLPLPRSVAFYLSAMILGPLLGSFITEPAAMTVTALMLKERYFDRGLKSSFLYLSLGLLFVNVSIGGVLTPFAAPPVIMVAGRWNWDMGFMLANFGWRAVGAVILNAALVSAFYFRDLKSLSHSRPDNAPLQVPFLVFAVHAALLVLVVINAHHPVIFVGIFLYFLGIAAITSEYQDPLKLKESLLVGFFLAGLVVLGGLQSWWLKPILMRLDEVQLYFAATALTAVIDNAALTYLAAQVEGIAEPLKYAVVAGAVSGGGLTVIANAPNPAGYSILRSSFGPGGISPLGLLLGALVPTLVAVFFFWIF